MSVRLESEQFRWVDRFDPECSEDFCEQCNRPLTDGMDRAVGKCGYCRRIEDADQIEKWRMDWRLKNDQ